MPEIEPLLKKSDQNLVWIDCEMTGLDPDKERLIEIAVIVTGPQLTPRIEGQPYCDWVLIDAGDVIIHVFRPDVRQFYNLEKMWGADRPVEQSGDLSVRVKS